MPMSLTLSSLVQEFLFATDLEAKKQMLEKHPELYSEEAEQLIESLISVFLMTEETKAGLHLRLQILLLRHCRELGVEEGFRQWKKLLDEATSSGIPHLDQRWNKVNQLIAQFEKSRRKKRKLFQALDLLEEIAADPEFEQVPETFRMGVINRLAIMWYEAHQMLNSLESLEKSIYYARLSLEGDSYVWRPIMGAMLGDLLLEQYHKMGNSDIELVVEAVELLKKYFQRLYNLSFLREKSENFVYAYALGLLALWRHTRNEYLDEAIRWCRKAIREYNPHEGLRLVILAQLVAALAQRFWSRNRPQDLDEAIELAQEGIALARKRKRKYAKILKLLKVELLPKLLLERHQRKGRRADLDEAIGYMQEKNYKYPAELGLGLALRYKLDGQEADFEKADELLTRSIEKEEEDHFFFLPLELAKLLMAHYRRTGRKEDLERAVAVLEAHIPRLKQTDDKAILRKAQKALRKARRMMK